MSLVVDEVMQYFFFFLQCMVLGSWVSTFHFSMLGVAVLSGFWNLGVLFSFFNARAGHS